MQNLASYAAALAMALECIRECGDSRWALHQGSPYHSMQQAGQLSLGLRCLCYAQAETRKLPSKQQCSAGASSNSVVHVHSPDDAESLKQPGGGTLLAWAWVNTARQ